MSKVRVHELAKKMGISNKELLEKLRSRGISVKNHMSIVPDQWEEERVSETVTKTVTKEPVVTKEPKVWNSSWKWNGPQYIDESFKNPGFTYGWVNYQEPGRVNAAQASGWQIDTDIKNKMGVFDMPGRGPATPIEGALIVGSSMLMRKPKGLAEAQFKLEQEQVVEPERVSNQALRRKLMEGGIPEDQIEEVMRNFKGGMKTTHGSTRV